MKRSRVIITSVPDSIALQAAISNCLEQFDWRTWLGKDSVVIIKPNCCTAVRDKVVGANTSVDVMEQLCTVLLSRTKRIAIGESAHLRQNPWQAFEASGYTAMAKRLGVELLNFSELPTARVRCEPIGQLATPT